MYARRIRGRSQRWSFVFQQWKHSIRSHFQDHACYQSLNRPYAVRIGCSDSSLIGKSVSDSSYTRGIAPAFTYVGLYGRSAPCLSNHQLRLYSSKGDGRNASEDNYRPVNDGIDKGKTRREKAGSDVKPCDVHAQLGEQDQKEWLNNEKLSIESKKKESPFLTRREKFKNEFLRRVVPWEKIHVSWETFPYYIHENTKNILVECVASHLKHKDLTASYGARLASSSGRILLQSVPGTELYRERLVRALAQELQVPLLVLDSSVLAPYDFGDDFASSESESDDDNLESAVEGSSESEIEDENDASNEEDWASSNETRTDCSDVEEVQATAEAALKKLVPYNLEEFERRVSGESESSSESSKSEVDESADKSKRLLKKGDRVKYIGPNMQSEANKRIILGKITTSASLPDDTVIQLFSCLNYRDRASLSSTCKTWRVLGASQCLWSSLDLRAHKFDTAVATSLASRCVNLQKLSFRGVESADAIIHLQAKNLREISGDYCRKINDATLAVIVARHEALESLQLGPDFCERITGDAIKAIAFCCPKLKKLRLSGIRDVYADAINALAKHCPNLVDIGFLDCLNVDEAALGNILSVCFLSVAGTSNMKWDVVSHLWHKLPKLIGLDVSRTDIGSTAVSRLLSSSQSLKVLCALNCPVLEEDPSISTIKTNGKLLLALFSDIFRGLSSLFAETSKKGRNVFLDWRCSKNKDKNLNEIMTWLEWILSHALLRTAESNPQGLDDFWLKQGAALLLSLMQSSQEDVQERAATGLATFVVIDDENASIDRGRAEAVMQDGGIRLLLNLAKSWRDGLQSEAAKAIANLSVNANVAKAVAEEGGINVLSGLARSMNRLVAEEAAGGLWNLSVGEEHKAAIAEAGGVKALVDLIFKWSSSGDGVLERAAGALANLAADDKCSVEVAIAGGVHALVMLARNCKFEGVQEQAARALANLASHGDSNSNNAAVGQEAGALEALVQLTRSPHEGVRQEAAGALWNLSFDDRNREAIAAAGGVEALVTLAQTCSNASPGLQERAAGALWGLSVSEANSIAIGREGGVAPLIALARSDAEDVHETAAGALWNLAFNHSNALRIVEEGGVPALVNLCSSSVSKMARFMAALALAYMFDGRIDEFAPVGTSSESTSKGLSLDGARRMALKHIEAFILTFSNPQAFAAAAASSAPAALAQVTEKARIQEAGHLRCSGAEIGRFVSMLRNSSSILKACAAFALLQFTIPGGRHAVHHASLMQGAGAARVLRAAAAAATSPIEAKIFARIVLRNLEHHQVEPSI